MKRLNIGCGDVPTDGWVNYDNSLAVKLAPWPLAVAGMAKLGLLTPKQQNFIQIVRQVGIKYSNAVKQIPEADNSAEVIYTCHMLEHLDRREAKLFLMEARRVLAPKGIIRIAVPDIRFHAEEYLKHGDANAFVEGVYMAVPRAEGMLGKLKQVLVGERHHLWMYDGKSLCQLLLEVGYLNPQALPAGRTTIPNPGNLDLAERAFESVFVEAVKP